VFSINLYERITGKKLIEFLNLCTTNNFNSHNITADTCTFKGNMKLSIIIIIIKKIYDLCKTCEQRPNSNLSGLNESMI